MAMGRGPFVSAIRPKVLRPRSERVQLTYSEPENPHRPPFDWGAGPTDGDDWFENRVPQELRDQCDRYVNGEPRVIST
jgi:hypothetical protein